MSKVKKLAFLSAILSCTFTLNSYADNCTVTAPVTNVNLNYAQDGRLSVDFKNCKNRVRPSFQWSNPAGNSAVFRLDSKPEVYIPVSFDSRMGANWDIPIPIVGASQTAASAYADFNTYFNSSSQIKNMTMYVVLPPSQYKNLAQYPVGTYRASITLSATEW